MPLKHQTETVLVTLLAVAMAATGVVIAVLSLLASPWLLWIAAFFVSLAYPLALYPHFRERRADYEFRLLHFAPAFFLLLWLLLTVLSVNMPFLFVLRTLLTVAWALPLVALGFVLLAWFSLHVIRQWPRRLLTLLLVFIPFAFLGMFGDRFHWNTQIAAMIDAETGTGASMPPQTIVARSAEQGIRIMSASLSSSQHGTIGQKPPLLPHAGGGIEFFAVIVPAATSAAVHLRALRRSRQA